MRLVDELQPLLDAEQRLLGRVGDDRDDQLVEDARRLRSIRSRVAIVHRIEHARVHCPLAHGEPRSSSAASVEKAWLSLVRGARRKVELWSPRKSDRALPGGQLRPAKRAAASWCRAGPPPALASAASPAVRESGQRGGGAWRVVGRVRGTTANRSPAPPRRSTAGGGVVGQHAAPGRGDPDARHCREWARSAP